MANRSGERPLRVIEAVAPVRICDTGGWTDTWFARWGRVCSIAVLPGAEVQVAVYPAGDRPRAVIDAVDGHQLLAAAVEDARVPPDLAVEVRVSSEMPAGASTGTSAAVVVAVLGALDRVTGGGLGRDELAAAAHRVETERLGLQSGVQDQHAALHGGVCWIEVDDYPRASVSSVPVTEPVWHELEQRLVLVYLGTGHRSSEVHRRVIAELEDSGPGDPRLGALRVAASRARDALVSGDLDAFGRALIANNDAQAALHPDLVGSVARQVIELGRSMGALGWKVNGAGGDGGSVTLLCAASGPDLVTALNQLGDGVRTIPITLSRHGLRTWEATKS